MKLSELRHIIQTGDPLAVDQAKKLRSEIIDRIGRKIGIVRSSNVMKLEQFAEFRRKIYMLPEDDREAEVDRLITLHNLDR